MYPLILTRTPLRHYKTLFRVFASNMLVLSTPDLEVTPLAAEVWYMERLEVYANARTSIVLLR